MNNLIVVQNVRGYIDEKGTAYLNLEDVARGLGFEKTEVKNGKEYSSIRWSRINDYLNSEGFDQKWSKEDFIPENAFYSLCMIADSEIAKKFRRVVCDEILPAIRKTGGYIATSEDETDEDIMAKAILVAQKTIERKNERIKELEYDNSEKDKKIAELEPQALYCKAMLVADGLLPIGIIAKDLGFKSATELNKELHRVGVQYKASKTSPWQLYSDYADKGYAKTIPQPRNTSKGFKSFPHLYWTEAGRKFIFELKQQEIIKTDKEKSSQQL
nr:MAG TPA: antirepressor protein [Caudoviricetes sp.]